MGAPLDDPPVIKHEDQIGMANSAQPMGDDDLCAGECVEILLDDVLCLDIKSASRLV